MLLTLWVSFFFCCWKKSILPRHDRARTRPGCCHVSHKINTCEQLSASLRPSPTGLLRVWPNFQSLHGQKKSWKESCSKRVILATPHTLNWQTARQTGATSSSSSSAAQTRTWRSERTQGRPHSISVMSFWPSLSDGVETDPGEFWSLGDLSELARLRRARLQREVKQTFVRMNRS